MPSARARRRGDFLNCRFAVYGIQKADCSSPAGFASSDSARLFMVCASNNQSSLRNTSYVNAYYALHLTLFRARGNPGMWQGSKRGAAIKLHYWPEKGTTFWRCSPRPWIFRVIISPGFRNTGVGLMPRPTPGGVPVQMMSPGSNVMYWLTCEMILAQLKIMVRVLPVCMRLPFTSRR